MRVKTLLAVTLAVLVLATGSSFAACPDFLAQTPFAAGSGATGVVTADFNNDGRVDIAVANRLANTITIIKSTPPTTFTASTISSGGNSPIDLAAADLNHDGDIDLVAANYTSGTAAVLLGNGDGSFQTPHPYAIGGSFTASSVAIGDLNDDTYPDLVVASTIENNVSVLIGHGDGTFAAAVPYAVSTYPASVAIADLTGDGKKDILVARFGNFGNEGLGVLRGRGDGTFDPVLNYATTGSSPHAVAAADLNGDGQPDVALAGDTQVLVWLNTGGGALAGPVAYDAQLFGAQRIVARDIDGDGRVDLAAGGRDDIAVLFGTGGGAFAPAVSITAGSHPWSVAVVDFDGDSRPDLVAANANSADVSVLLNTCTAAPPRIDALAPPAGPVAGGQTVTISGASLAGATGVSVGGSPAAIVSSSETSVIVTTPAHAAGSASVSVTTPLGTSTLPGAYAYVAPPTVSDVSPATGASYGNQLVVLGGTNFDHVLGVTFGGAPAQLVTYSDTTMTVLTPAHDPGPVTVTVTTAGGVATWIHGASPGQFSFVQTAPIPSLDMRVLFALALALGVLGALRLRM